jgi:hypothetical protein
VRQPIPRSLTASSVPISSWFDGGPPSISTSSASVVVLGGDGEMLLSVLNASKSDSCMLSLSSF